MCSCTVKYVIKFAVLNAQICNVFECLSWTTRICIVMKLVNFLSFGGEFFLGAIVFYEVGATFSEWRRLIRRKLRPHGDSILTRRRQSQGGDPILWHRLCCCICKKKTVVVFFYFFETLRGACLWISRNVFTFVRCTQCDTCTMFRMICSHCFYLFVCLPVCLVSATGE